MNLPAAGKPTASRWCVWLCLALILTTNFGIRWHLRGLPLERDEGEYAYAGQLLLAGTPPYQIAWNMKFPGVYFAYAALMAVFGQTAEGIHLGIILVTSLSIILVFLIGLELSGALAGLVASLLFMLMTVMPSTYGLAGHATHFVGLMVCAGTYALLLAERKWTRLRVFVSGAAFGAAILMKQHAAVFTLAALGRLVFVAVRQKVKPAWRAGMFIAGVVLPLALTAGFLTLAGVWGRFYYWTIEYARVYVSIFPLTAAPRQFADGFGPVFAGGMWPWLLSGVAMALLFGKTAHARLVRAGAGWLVAGLIAACPGLYFRNHYFLMAIPGVALLNTALVLELRDRAGKYPQIRVLRFAPVILLLALTGELVARNAPEWFGMSIEALSRKLYGYSPFPESPVVAQYLATNTLPTDTIAVLGSEPQLFFLAHRRSASGYIYLYPMTEPQPLAAHMREEFEHEIEAARPRYVVYVNSLSSWCSAAVPGETGKILDAFNDWWDRYKSNYELVGMVDMSEDRPTEYYWDGQLASRTNPAPANISVFRRK